jgi:hypothetical protein
MIFLDPVATYICVMDEKGLGYFTGSRKEIMDELIGCRDSNSAVGIWSACLGKGMFICFVKEVVADEDEDDVVVILNENDLSGPNMETHVVYLHEIEKIYRFRTTPNATLQVHSINPE